MALKEEKEKIVDNSEVVLSVRDLTAELMDTDSQWGEP